MAARTIGLGIFCMHDSNLRTVHCLWRNDKTCKVKSAFQSAPKSQELWRKHFQWNQKAQKGLLNGSIAQFRYGDQKHRGAKKREAHERADHVPESLRKCFAEGSGS